MSTSFFNVFSKSQSRRGSSAGDAESKPKLTRSESRRAKDGSQANMASINREDSVKKSSFGLRREDSVSKKKDTVNRRGPTLEKRDSHSKKDRKHSRARNEVNPDGSNRRGSLTPGSDARKLSSVFYVPELLKISDNQIINLNTIQDDMHTFRMIKFSSDMIIRLRSPMDDLETLVVPVSSKSFAEIMQELYTITSNYRYLRQIEILNWARDEEMIDDVLCAFEKKMVEFDSTNMTSKMLESFAAGTAWEVIHKAISDIYVWVPMDNESLMKSLFQELKTPIMEHLLIIIGHWTWYLRQSHVSLCTQISIWFNAYSADDWKKSQIPVVYGAFKVGCDITSLFAQIYHGSPTLDLVTLNLVCTKISNSLAKYPNQKEFLHLDLFRQFVEFRSKLLIMSKLLQLCKILEIDKEKVFNAIKMYDETEKKDPKSQKKEAEKICAFSRIFKTKNELMGSLFDLKKANTSSSFAAVYPKVLNSILAPCFNKLTFSLAASFTGSKKYELPETYPKTVSERRKVEAIVNKLTPKTIVQEQSVESNHDSFFAGGIAIQIDEAPELIPEIAIFDTDPDNEPGVKNTIAKEDVFTKLGKENTLLKTRNLDDVELDDILTMPESVCKTHYRLNWEDKDTLEAIFGISFGNVDFGDIKRVLKVIGCSIITEDGVSLLVSHPRSKIPISFMAPFPDLHYKLYALDRIKNAIQDFLGIYYENFDFK